MAECAAVCEHLHLPLQSGSDRTLARMHRGYTAERYLDRLADARAAIPDLAVTTDLIVGFPGETDADFERTLEVVDAAAYDAAYTFVFSPRPGTPAADMTDDFVAPEVAQERMSRLIEVVERHALAKHEARVGRTETVLVEGPSKKDPTMWSGRTRQNKLVHFAPGVHEPEVGGGADVRVTRAAPHWLRGDLLAMAPAPPPRPASASPSPPRLRDRHRTSRSSAPPRRGSRRSRSRWRGRSATSRSCRSTRCRSTAASTSAPPSPPAAERAAVPHHLIDVADPDDEWSVARFQREARAAVADIEARGQPRAARRRHRAVRAGGDRPAHLPAARTATVRDRARGRDRRRPAGLAAAYAELHARRPRRRGRASSPATPGGSCGRSR